ncbi:MAG TPA: hypothetical protein VFB72_17580, partial [Verrucomicrobiae bacterium]|nr:hypothetical protein [Verrucomicrobiae bacterium]
YIVTSFRSNGLYMANLQSTPIAGNVGGVAVQGQYAFLPFQTSFHSYLISTNGPKLVAQLNYPSNTVGVVALSGSYAYFGCGDGVRVVNISNPTNLVPAGQTTTNAYGTFAVYGIAVSGPYAYVANGQDGLRVFEILPSLSASQISGNLVFSWPATSSFALQQRSLTDTNWTTLTNVPILVNGTNQLTLSPSGTSAFYRLISM